MKKKVDIQVIKKEDILGHPDTMKIVGEKERHRTQNLIKIDTTMIGQQKAELHLGLGTLRSIVAMTHLQEAGVLQTRGRLPIGTEVTHRWDLDQAQIVTDTIHCR